MINKSKGANPDEYLGNTFGYSVLNLFDKVHSQKTFIEPVSQFDLNDVLLYN